MFSRSATLTRVVTDVVTDEGAISERAAYCYFKRRFEIREQLATLHKDVR